MAAVHTPAQVYLGQNGSNRSHVITWGVPTSVASPGDGLGNTPRPGVTFTGPTYTHLASSDTCSPVFMPALTDKTVQITGTTGAGGSITLVGSNDGVNFVALHDVFGVALSALVPGTIYQINEDSAWVNALIVGGDGTTAMNVIIAGKRPF